MNKSTTIADYLENSSNPWVLKAKAPIKDYLIIHHDDTDGVTGGLIAQKYITNKVMDSGNVVLFKTNYNQPIPKHISDMFVKTTAVFIIDFSFKREFTMEINNKVGFLQILDHHISSKGELMGLDYAHFDMTKSGALLAWEYFYPDKEPSEALTLIDNYDLWKKTSINVDALEMYLNVYKSRCGYDSYLELIRHLISPLGGYRLGVALERGTMFLEKSYADVEKIIKSQIPITLLGHPAKVVFSSISKSELGAALYSQPDHENVIAVIAYVVKDKVIVSLRSSAKGNVDVSLVAEHYGGGGHTNAAAFSLPHAEAFKVLLPTTHN